MKITISETAAWLLERDNFLVLTHIRPDGDTLGCAAALTQGLRELGKTAFALLNPETTPNFIGLINDYYAPEGYRPDYIISVDTASEALLQRNASEYIGMVSLCIDHHQSNQMYAKLTCLYETCASCGEIVHDILVALSGSISPKSAEAIYIALTTDTGCFAYANTTSNTLRIAAQTIDAGAPHKVLNKKLFRTKSHNRLHFECLVISGLEFCFDGAVCISMIPRTMMDETGVSEDDIDNISLLPGVIEGVSAGITIRELTGEQDCKISVRTMHPIDASEICKRFGGGGHKLAAGASGPYTLNEFKEKLIAVLRDFFPTS